MIDWRDLFLTFDGRINRAKYWIGVGVCFALVIVGFVFYGLIPILGLLIALAAYLAALAVSVVIGIKRLHDRDKSAKWLLVFYGLPFLLNLIGGWVESLAVSSLFMLAAFGLSLWCLVELGILRGTVGPNRYGADPLGESALRAA